MCIITIGSSAIAGLALRLDIEAFSHVGGQVRWGNHRKGHSGVNGSKSYSTALIHAEIKTEVKLGCLFVFLGKLPPFVFSMWCG